MTRKHMWGELQKMGFEQLSLSQLIRRFKTTNGLCTVEIKTTKRSGFTSLVCVGVNLGSTLVSHTYAIANESEYPLPRKVVNCVDALLAGLETTIKALDYGKE